MSASQRRVERTLDQEATYDAIGDVEVSESDLEAARAFLGRFAYTTNALLALEMVLGELERDGDGDSQGSAILDRAGNEMWDLEARTA